ncbi:MAG: HpcH/HpaI aldolase family protein [Planctomycetota bacterium]|jgi:4-hydroxy-2-oxoheptanedioate aldolase
MKNLKKRIVNGETLIGCWLNLGSSITAEIVGMAGFDWVLIDLEHGSGTDGDVLHQLQALEHTPAAPVVRVESYERQRFHRILDLGAAGIMCPRINNPEEAHRAADAMRYQPEGLRGVAQMVRATNFGADSKDYLASSKDTLVGIVQVESKEVLEHLDEIAAIDGVDLLFVGPSDLSMALGIFGQLDHPRFIDALKTASTAAKKAGKATGVLMRSPEEFTKYHDLGFRFIACGADATFVASGARSTAGTLNDLRASSK